MLTRAEDDIIVIEDSDSDQENIEIVEEIINQPVDLSPNNRDGPEVLSEYQEVLDFINADLGITEENKDTPERDIMISNVFSHEVMQPISENKEDFRPHYEKLLLENKNLMSSLNKMLECPVCLNIVRTIPVPSCRNGHIMCSSCWQLSHLCPLCRVKLHQAEKCFSQTANTMLELVTLPCPYQDEGCMAEGLRGDMEQHAMECMYKVEEDDTGERTCTVSGCLVAKQGAKQGTSATTLTYTTFQGIPSTPTSTASLTNTPTNTPPRAVSTTRRHCSDCNRDFSRGYFTRHVCVQGVWRNHQDNTV